MMSRLENLAVINVIEDENDPAGNALTELLVEYRDNPGKLHTYTLTSSYYDDQDKELSHEEKEDMTAVLIDNIIINLKEIASLNPSEERKDDLYYNTVSGILEDIEAVYDDNKDRIDARKVVDENNN